MAMHYRGCLLAAAASLALVASGQKVGVTFRNEMDVDAELAWVHPETKETTGVGRVPAYGGELHQDTWAGHTFKYDQGEVTIRGDRTFYSLTKTGTVRVACGTTVGNIGISVFPDWAPRGAGRFLELVRRKYFDGAAINRVVPRFLAQFGISKDYETRTRWRTANIPDDPKQRIPFEAGMIAYAGSGPDSRSTEMFFVMPDTPKHQLDHFGTNPWETPFAVCDPGAVRDVLPKLANPYGDMPPWGNGPDPQKIYRRGGYDDYLAADFPELAYFTECTVDEAPMPVVGPDL